VWDILLFHTTYNIDVIPVWMVKDYEVMKDNEEFDDDGYDNET
jgi:hypothetical protein